MYTKQQRSFTLHRCAVKAVHTTDSCYAWAAAARGGSEGKAMDEFELVTYSYSFFHLIFALASMYIAMLMTGWGTGAEERDLIDVGWTSVWVKVVAQWMTVAVYAWTMAAPLVFPDRDFS